LNEIIYTAIFVSISSEDEPQRTLCDVVNNVGDSAFDVKPIYHLAEIILSPVFDCQ